jgi:hypothetical protein
MSNLILVILMQSLNKLTVLNKQEGYIPLMTILKEY